MKKIIPFYYEVRFNLIKYDNKNNFNFESYKKECINEEPLLARIEAFKSFNDVLSDLKENNRIAKDERGNYFIKQPKFVTDLITNLFNKSENISGSKSKKTESIKAFNDLRKRKQEIIDRAYKYNEELSVVLITQDEKIFREYVIHQIQSYGDVDALEQELVDNLAFVELKLYKNFKIDVSQYIKQIFHYGLTYYLADGNDEAEESMARREILETPYIWNSTLDEPHIHSKSKDNETGLNFEEIIKNGESNQVEFKPTLLYNFKSKKAGISIKFIIAKTIGSLLNSNGGLLFIGVNDNGKIQGIDFDYSLFNENSKKDKILLEVDNLITQFLNVSLKPFVTTKIINIQAKDILVIKVDPSTKPIFVQRKRDNIRTKHFYVRLNASTHEIKDVEHIIDYIFNNWLK